MNRAGGVVIASADATVIITGAAGLRAAEQQQKSPDDKVWCEGINDCARQRTCAGSHSSLAGLNSCEGKGVVDSTLKECVCQGGKVVEKPPTK